MFIEAVLSGMSNEERDYGNFSGLFRHLAKGEIARIFEKGEEKQLAIIACCPMLDK